MSDRDSALMIVGVSCCGDLGTLQTLRSPSAVWVASMSDFCLEEVPCHASPVMRDGAREVVRVCRIVKAGLRVAMRIEPLRYLVELATKLGDTLRKYIPDRKCAVVTRRSNSGDRIEYCSRTNVLICRWLKKYDGTLNVACNSISLRAQPHWHLWSLTESNIAVSHEMCHIDRIIRHETCDLSSCEDVPHHR